MQSSIMALRLVGRDGDGGVPLAFGHAAEQRPWQDPFN
jgi:hypothetical protein